MKATTFLSSSAAAAVLLLAAGFAWAEPPGLDTARESVRQGTAVAPEVLRGVEEQVPEDAKPAIRRSREASGIGQREALEALDRSRDMGGGPPIGAVPGRPPFAGGPPAGVGRGRP
jgi:hypothetical protein